MKPIHAPDIASGLYQGERPSQQDAVDAFTDPTTGVSILALSDGMGGAGYGNLASRLILRTALASLTSRCGDMAAQPDLTPDLLRNAAFAANRRLASFILDNPDKSGMGGTLIMVVLINRTAYWLSIGDSLVYRIHKGELIRLNADHSLASGLENLAKLGQIDPKLAKSMASRSTLTSAVMGQKLKQIDCPDTPLTLLSGDSLLLASDGLETLPKTTLNTWINDATPHTAAQTVAGLISLTETAQVSGQDNLALSMAAFD